MVCRQAQGSSGVFSQGESLEKLEENIRDVYRLMIEEGGVLALPQTAIIAKELGVESVKRRCYQPFWKRVGAHDPARLAGWEGRFIITPAHRVK